MKSGRIIRAGALFLCLFPWFHASALPQYQRLLRKEYGYKTPCATCHAQGGGSALSGYGKAFERAGKNAAAVGRIAELVPAGDTLSYGAKLKARADPNDPVSTPAKPGNWTGQSDIPRAELKEFTPPEVDGFSFLEGELSPAQVEKLKTKLGALYQDEDKFPSFYFGEVAGKKTYVVQYVRLAALEKTLGLVVSTRGDVVGLSFVGANKGPVPKKATEALVGRKIADVEKAVTLLNGEDKAVAQGVVRGLTSIVLVFSGGKQ